MGCCVHIVLKRCIVYQEYKIMNEEAFRLALTEREEDECTKA